MRPLHLTKTIRHSRRLLGDTIHHHREQEGLIIGHQKRALHGKAPLEPEIPLAAGLSVFGNHRHEEPAIADALANQPVPGISATQLTLIEPYLDPCRLQRLGKAMRRLCILGGITEKDGLPA